MTRITLELGGSRAGHDLRRLRPRENARHGRAQKFRNAGQCASRRRALLQESIYEAFLKGFAERTQKVKVGDGLLADTRMGPLANPAAPRRSALIDDARQKGARVLAGGGRATAASSSSRPCSPDVPNSAEIMNEEPFGPGAVTPSSDLRRSDRTSQPPALRPRRLCLHRKRPPRQPPGRRDRKRHGRHQYFRDFDGGRSVRRGSGFRVWQRRRQGGLETYQFVKAIHQA